MPLHKEVPSLWKIAAKTVSKLVIDSVVYITNKYGDWNVELWKQACVENAFELQQLLHSNFGCSVHKLNKEIQIEADHHTLELFSYKVLLAVLIRSDMEVFDYWFSVSMLGSDVGDVLTMCTQVHNYIFMDKPFWRNRLEQCYRLVELDVRTFGAEFIATCDYFREVSNNCKNTLAEVSFYFYSCEQAVSLFNNLQKCKKLKSVKGYLFGADLTYDMVTAQYAIGVKMFVESLPELSTLVLSGMHNVLQKYEELNMVGFSSTSLTSFNNYIFPRQPIMLCNLLDLCPNIKKILIHIDIPCASGTEDILNNYYSDALLMICLNSKAFHLQSLAVILFSDNLSYNITQLTSIGGNLTELELNLYSMTATDVFVLGQVCRKLEKLSLIVVELAHSKSIFPSESNMYDMDKCVIFKELKYLAINSFSLNFYFRPYVQVEDDDKNLLHLILKNARNLEDLELKSFDHNFNVIIPFFQDGTLKNLKLFEFCGRRHVSKFFILTKDTLRLILDKCPKLAFLKLLLPMTHDATRFVSEYQHQKDFNNLALEIHVEE